jgi:hypothetical protein
MRRTLALLIVGILAAIFAVALAAPAQADPPVPGTCSYSAGVVTAAGLPTDAVINFFVTDQSGTIGVVYGYSIDGTAQENVPVPTVPTTYDFGSVTRGPSGDPKFWTYAECAT